MSCIFRVVGSDFDVDAFLNDFALTPYRVFHKGERRGEKSIHEQCGFTMVASDAEMEEPPQQVRDAIEFLKANQVELEKLRHVPGVTMCLDFGIADRDVVVQCDRFPPELLRLAGNLEIGIEISHYA